MNSLPRLDAGRLLAEALGAPGTAPRSALTGDPWLLVDLEPHALPHAGERAALTRWLQHQACPVIGIAAGGLKHPLAFACDTVLEDAAQAGELVRNIEATPLAAMVLVQVLRATEGLETEHALVIESFAYATLQGGTEFRRWLANAVRPAAQAGDEPEPPVLVERADAQLRLRLNRPARRNALSVPMRDALAEALELVLADTSIAQVIVSGEGSCFSAGGELAEFGSVADTATGHAVRSARSVAALLARCAPRLTVRVHGAAVGAGAEMAAFAARVEASADAFFQLPELRYGLIPGCGGCVSIPRRIGRLRTAYLALSARRLDAGTACGWGLVDAVTPSLPARASIASRLRRIH
ncbi:MAG TPA: enoyl-CoA hydratase/isomerase family protein [Steroidobacteraceae bacterium]|nr:enoyl-CoA hydratase/isomerase family protein [Steroidobacteraceae bacterium]